MSNIQTKINVCNKASNEDKKETTKRHPMSYSKIFKKDEFTFIEVSEDFPEMTDKKSKINTLRMSYPDDLSSDLSKYLDSQDRKPKINLLKRRKTINYEMRDLSMELDLFKFAQVSEDPSNFTLLDEFVKKSNESSVIIQDFSESENKFKKKAQRKKSFIEDISLKYSGKIGTILKKKSSPSDSSEDCLIHNTSITGYYEYTFKCLTQIPKIKSIFDDEKYSKKINKISFKNDVLFDSN
jgi:hypothetical protein